MSNLLEQASLVMIPSGYAEDIVYSEIPIDGSGDLQFTRSSNGTRVNSAGLVEVCPWNFVAQSESFDNAAWVKTTDGQVTITANATTAPNGTTTAEKMIASAIAGFHCVAQTQSLVAGVFTISIYAKASEYSFLQIFDSLTTDFANFNLTTGAVATVDQYTATIENVGNGWYRCTATKTNPSGNFVFRYGIVTTGTATRGESFTGNGVNGLFIWGAQINIGSTAKPYFPTTDRLNVPRLTYQNGGGGCPSLLLEKQSTNLALYSEQFDNANWIKNGTTVTANNRISPDGTQDADSVNFSGGGPIEQLIYYAADNLTHTISVWAKVASGTQQFRLKITHAGVVDYYSPYYTATTEWQRFSFSQAFGSGGIGFYAGVDGGNTMDLWGFQLEPNTSYVSSYIPTTSSSATRVADACFKTGISSLIGQSEGSIFLDFVVNGQSNAGNAINIYNNDYTATTTSTIAITYDQGTISCFAFRGNGTYDNISVTGSGYSIGQRLKVAYRYKSGDFALYVNGVQKDTDTSTLTFNGTKLEIYLNALNVYYAYPDAVQYNEFVQFPTALTNAELQAISTI